ncbi:hypothetical protein FACS189434_03100 [Bacteroidia bacterium]|nr:hypothetical protein FACS189434_03100 [Bacteroidia bacterium]
MSPKLKDKSSENIFSRIYCYGVFLRRKEKSIIFAARKLIIQQMRALEFKSKIRNNSIQIPNRMQTELSMRQGKNVRVIIFVEDADVYNEKQTARQALRHSVELAEQYGLSSMTMEDINAEINAVR